MTNLRDFVSALTIEDCREMHSDYSIFEKEGSIGDCKLREATVQFVNEAGLVSPILVIIMDMMMKEVWRRFADPILIE